MQMFKASNEISGIDKKTLPVELIPLNSIQLSRGLLNFTVLQSKLNWIFPYWIVQQYNPNSKSFVPRSHLGLSMNITHRNWTAVGSPDCEIEPIVDPRGLVTPFKNSWSVDVWLIAGDTIFFPSSSETAEQNLIDNIPVIITKFEFNSVKLELTAYTYKSNLYCDAKVINDSRLNILLKVIYSIRPFNPEGISLLKKIEFKKEENCFNIQNTSTNHKVYFNSRPDLVHCSNFKEGDAALILHSHKNGQQTLSSYCSSGLANSIAVFNIDLIPAASKIIEAIIPLKEDKDIQHADVNQVKSYWNNILDEGIQVNTPDSKINSILRSSISTLLMFTDKDTITPGPFTYHQFWFRDAAYMVWALDNFGYHQITRKIIEAYPYKQTKDGYFRSQKGEWDSNGQAVWTVYQHYKFTGDFSLLSSLFDSLFLAVKWISTKRLTNSSFKDEPFFGLMPVGMSAEHLGLADHYFWDNFWSIAGIKAFIEICKILGREEELKFAESLYTHYNLSLEIAIENVQKKYSLNVIPASPSRSIDCGMIGSICAGYPLQLFKNDDQRILSTLNVLKEKYFIKGLFFQHFIHSGMNPYLTLQIAHSYLYAGERELFQEILNNVISFASSTNNFPEAVHPVTLGGSMGDGHHGWAAAELLLAIHDAFIFEYDSASEKKLIMMQGIPKEWFNSSSSFYIKNAKVSDGDINLTALNNREKNEITIIIEFNGKISTGRKWILNLPFDCVEIKEGSEYMLNSMTANGNTIIELLPGSIILKFVIQNKEHAVPNSL